MKIQNKLAGIAEGLYFLRHQEQKVLPTIYQSRTPEGGGR